MSEPSEGRRAAALMRRDTDAIAADVTARLYAERPSLLAKHGSAGRDRCLEDVRYTLEHLIPAVELEQPPMFASYVRWLDELLRARNVATDDVTRSLELIGDAVDARVADDARETVRVVLDAGLAVLAPAAADARP